MTTRLIGKEGVYQGKSLFEIAANLKNMGVGRVVYRNEFMERYPEKSYYRLTRVWVDNSRRAYKRGHAYGYKVFRGAKFPGEAVIGAAYKEDWKLVPKEDEEEFCKIDKVYTKDLNRGIELDESLPPLMDLLVKQQLKNLGKEIDMPLKLHRRTTKFRPNRWSRATCSVDETGTLVPREDLTEIYTNREKPLS